MNVLAVNCGSSTLKFQLIDMEGARTLARGIVERISGPAAIEFSAEGGQVLQEAAPVADHGEATQRLLKWLGDVGLGQAVGLDGLLLGSEAVTFPRLLLGANPYISGGPHVTDPP
jgi:acetate kinase